MDLLRRGGMGGCSAASGRRRRWVPSCAPSPSEHVRQLDAVASRFLPRLAGQAPILAGAERMLWLDLDDTVIQTYGYAKQAAGRGYTGVKGLNALVATASTRAAPVIAATRGCVGCPTSSATVTSQVTSLDQPSSRC
jgi:hypothetical protein